MINIFEDVWYTNAGDRWLPSICSINLPQISFNVGVLSTFCINVVFCK